VPAEYLVTRLQLELRTEREQVLEPLLHRLQLLGKNLTEGLEVPPEVIEEGLVLWEAYLRTLHDTHVGQFRLAGASEDHPERCAVPLAEIESDPDRGIYRIRAIRAMASGYKAHVGGYRMLLGLILDGEAHAELAWEGFEEDYAKTCLPTHLTPTVVREWTAALDQSRHETLPLREKVREYLVRTTPFLVLPA